MANQQLLRKSSIQNLFQGYNYESSRQDTKASKTTSLNTMVSTAISGHINV